MEESRERTADVRVRVPGDENVDVKLAGERTERVEVARGDTLVAVHEPDAYRRVRHGDGKREGALRRR